VSEDVKGLVMVYTGDGKGKTTAALGLALRQIGWGRKTLFLQFMKGEGNVYGERIAAERYLPDLEIEQWGRDSFVDLNDPDQIDRVLAEKGFERAKEAINSGEYGLVVLDEACIAMACGLLPTQEVIELIESRPSHVDIVLTGRYCPQSIIDIADMVSEVKEIKHHFTRGIKARKGIEY